MSIGFDRALSSQQTVVSSFLGFLIFFDQKLESILVVLQPSALIPYEALYNRKKAAARSQVIATVVMESTPIKEKELLESYFTLESHLLLGVLRNNLQWHYHHVNQNSWRLLEHITNTI